MQNIQPGEMEDPSSQTGFVRTKRAPKVKQACDCCHARKIKCDGQNPCNNCTTTELSCTYLSIPKKKGPKGPSKRTPRAVLKMQAEQQQRAQAAQHGAAVSIMGPPSRSTTMSSLNSGDTSTFLPLNGWQPPSLLAQETSESWSPMAMPDIAASDGLLGWQPSQFLTFDLAKEYAAAFFEQKYPITPILHRDSFYESLPEFRLCPSMYALVSTLCASLFNQVELSETASGIPNGVLSTDFFIAEAKHAREKAGDYIEKPTLSDIHTSFFIFAGLFDIDRHNSAWFYLREAITLMETVKLHEEQTYLKMDPQTALFSRRTFWLLFVTERAYALQSNRQWAMSPTIDLPTTSPDEPDDKIICGFLDLVRLFQNLESNFISKWNWSSRNPVFRRISLDLSDPARRASAASLAALQSALGNSLPSIGERTDAQKADLLTTKLWLRTMTWQYSNSQGHLSSSSNSEALSYTFPLAIAREFAEVSSSLTPDAFNANGPGILRKVFDIGCALADVIQVRPQRRASMERGAQEYLTEMLRLLSTTKAGHKYRGMLLDKAEECFRPSPMVMGSLNGNVTGDEHRATEIRVDEEGTSAFKNTSERITSHPYSRTSEGFFRKAWAIGDDGSAGRMINVTDDSATLSGGDTDEEIYDFGTSENDSSAWTESLGTLGGAPALPVAQAPGFQIVDDYYII